MAKLLTWLLAITLVSNGAILLYQFLDLSLFTWNADRPSKEEMKGVTSWNYEFKSNFKKYSLGRTFKIDSLNPNGNFQNYLHLNSATSLYTVNNQPFVIKGAKKYFPENSNNNTGLRLPISYSQYLNFKISNLVFLVIYIIGLFFFISLLYKFSRSAINGDFFSHSNINRLKWLGSIIISGFFGLNIIDWWFEKYISSSLGYSGINFHSSFSLFPHELITGLMLWVIAAAFQKGQELQKEQQLTI